MDTNDPQIDTNRMGVCDPQLIEVKEQDDFEFWLRLVKKTGSKAKAFNEKKPLIVLVVLLFLFL
jgi:hypothetical protein